MADDWRIRIELEPDGGTLERLGFELGAEARELARELEQHRLAVSRDGNDLFVYAGSYPEALRALAVIEAELREQDAKATHEPHRALARGRGALGRRAGARRAGRRSSSPRATRRGRCACSAARAARRTPSPTGSSRRATPSRAASTT